MSSVCDELVDIIWADVFTIRGCLATPGYFWARLLKHSLSIFAHALQAQKAMEEMNLEMCTTEPITGEKLCIIKVQNY